MLCFALNCGDDGEDGDKTGTTEETGTTDDSSDNGAGTLTAKVDGADFSATQGVSGTYASNILAVAGADIVFSSGGATINMAAYNVTGPGTYTFSTTSGSAIFSQGTNVYSIAFGGTGSLTVDELTTDHAKGSFEYTVNNQAGDSVSVTDGSFNVTLIQQD